MPDSTPSPSNNEPAPKYVEVTVNAPADFLAACAEQGLDPAATTARLLGMAGDSLHGGAQLFQNWEEWTPEERKKWMLGGVEARMRVEGQGKD